SAVYLGDDENKLVAELGEEYPRAKIVAASNGFERWVKEVLLRIGGQPPHMELPLDLQATAFQRRVWKELQRIPCGHTRSYSQVARSLGRPKAVRAVARACAANPVSIVVPCHRVIREDGALAGYRCGAGPGSGSLGLPVATRRSCFQGMQQPRRGAGEFVNGRVESCFVGFRRMVEAGDFPHELQGSGAHFFRRDRRIEIEKRFDVAAHGTASGV